MTKIMKPFISVKIVFRLMCPNEKSKTIYPIEQKQYIT